jgi:hypothetical protein
MLKTTNRGVDMNEVATLSKAEPREILQTVLGKKVSSVLSYLSKGKWHVAKVSLTNLGDDRLDIRLLPKKADSRLRKSHQTTTSKQPSINIQVHQPVGISLKYGYGKFIFETTVVAIQPSTEPASGGTISLMIPERIEMVQRRSYFRVDVPSSLKVNVMLWHRRYTDEPETQQTETQTSDSREMPQERYWQGKLTDISAGGVQVIVDTAQKPDFERGQFIGLRFTPMPYETPLMFDAQIRNVLPTACEKGICLGLRIVGLEASPEGRQVLQRLCSVAECYYQINQCTLNGQDFQMTGLPH